MGQDCTGRGGPCRKLDRHRQPTEGERTARSARERRRDGQPEAATRAGSVSTPEAPGGAFLVLVAEPGTVVDDDESMRHSVSVHDDFHRASMRCHCDRIVEQVVENLLDSARNRCHNDRGGRRTSARARPPSNRQLRSTMVDMVFESSRNSAGLFGMFIRRCGHRQHGRAGVPGGRRLQRDCVRAG